MKNKCFGHYYRCTISSFKKKKWIGQFVIFFPPVTHPFSFFNEVFSADMGHDSCGQSISHHIDHGAESVSEEVRTDMMNRINLMHFENTGG